ncbi:MAG: hypothetical protein WCA91_23020 [Candidatus Acidiferrales bacterium]
MKREYDFSKAKRGAVLTVPKGKTRITIRLDDEILAWFRDHHLLPSVRADLLHKLGRLDEARAEFARAASLTQNSRERNLLLSRAASCAPNSN